MAEPSAKSFLDILQRSGIVEEDRLQSLLDELSKKAGKRSVKVDELTAHLINSGVITKWHCEKLLSGKYKGFFLGKYKLLGHLGTGGMSSVYLAEHKISGQKRAIKVLPRKKVSDRSYLDRFYLEGRAAASLNHPHIVKIYDICSDGNTHFMVMEFVEGTDLYEMVKTDGPLDFEKAARFTIQAAKGLGHAHQRKLVHRDIKPANLLLTGDQVVKILDLGLALFRENEESLTVLYNERVMGTADYLSPEQAVNSHEVDHRADIYSLGCTLYYFLTGHPPFPEGSLAQRIAMHQTKDPNPVQDSRPDCPQPLIDICSHMMRKSADDRYQNTDELQSALKRFLKSHEATKSSNGGTGATVHAAQRGNTSKIRAKVAARERAKVVGVAKQNSGQIAAAAGKANPIQIDLGADSKKNNTRLNAKDEIRQVQRFGRQTTATKGTGKKTRSTSNKQIWLLLTLVVLMFVALILVLSLAFWLTQRNQQTMGNSAPTWSSQAAAMFRKDDISRVQQSAARRNQIDVEASLASKLAACEARPHTGQANTAVKARSIRSTKSRI